MLDRLLAHYGAETKEVRDELRSSVVGSLDRIWPEERSRTSEAVPPSTTEVVLEQTRIVVGP
jgi:hypothetical protein